MLLLDLKDRKFLDSFRLGLVLRLVAFLFLLTHSLSKSDEFLFAQESLAEVAHELLLVHAFSEITPELHERNALGTLSAEESSEGFECRCYKSL
jgi:hypothetical protein